VETEEQMNVYNISADIVYSGYGQTTENLEKVVSNLLESSGLITIQDCHVEELEDYGQETTRQ
jgi:menaquinone-dependent protoporphyrinogen IX oxidase